MASWFGWCVFKAAPPGYPRPFLSTCTQQDVDNGITIGPMYKTKAQAQAALRQAGGNSPAPPPPPPAPAPAGPQPGPGSPPLTRVTGAAQPGDLACWGPNEHMGIVTGPDQMVSAQDPANGTAISAVTAFFATPPVILRLRAVAATGSLKGNQSIAALLAGKYGWSPSQDKAQWQALTRLWAGQSNWSVTARNPSSGAYGIPQALPGDKMAAAGPDWRTSARTQITWGLGYIADTYGSPAAALAHEQAHGWY